MISEEEIEKLIDVAKQWINCFMKKELFNISNKEYKANWKINWFIIINCALGMSHIIIDPVCLFGISTYHEKKLPSNVGASYGILYAMQKELTYHVSFANALGTNQESP